MTNFRETVVGFLVAWIVKDEVVARQPVNSICRVILYLTVVCYDSSIFCYHYEENLLSKCY